MGRPSDRGFATTRWTLVFAASRESAPHARAALEELCGLYWGPLYAFARRLGHSVEQAQDPTQAFFVHLLEKQTVRAADPLRGRFRSFLLASFKHFLANEWDRERAKKRGGAESFVALDVQDAEALYAARQPDALAPDAVFERQWALDLMTHVAARLRAEYVEAGKEPVFDRLKGLVTGDAVDVRYADLAREIGSTEGAVKVMAHRLRRRYRDLLRAEIASTVDDDADVDVEIAFLITAVGG